MTSPLLQGGVCGADRLLGFVPKGENIWFQMGVIVSSNPGIEKASCSELVLFGPSKICLLASPCHASCGKRGRYIPEGII